MKQLNIAFKRTSPRAVIPKYATAGSGCFDLFPLHDVRVSFGTPTTIDTGLAFEIEPGYVMFVFSRSGHGFKYDVTLANGTGIIDNDYRDSVKLKLRCDEPGGDYTFPMHKAIAQAIILPFPKIMFNETSELSETVRGAGGFGSTDRVEPATPVFSPSAPPTWPAKAESPGTRQHRDEMDLLLTKVMSRFGVMRAKSIIRDHGKSLKKKDIPAGHIAAVIDVCERALKEADEPIARPPAVTLEATKRADYDTSSTSLVDMAVHKALWSPSVADTSPPEAPQGGGGTFDGGGASGDY